MIARHHSRDVLLALAEREDGVEDRHLDVCEACRLEVAALRDTLADLRRIEVPEPSPLYWEHLSSRIRARVVADAIAAPPQPRWLPWLAWAVPLTAVTAIALVVVGHRTGPLPDMPVPSMTPAAVIVADPEWEALLDIVGGPGALGADVIPAKPGTADRLVGELDEHERQALVTLLRRELEGP